MNKLQDLAKLLKVEVNEIFHIECSNGIVYENEYFLGETGNIMMKDATHPEGLPTVWLPELITGKSKIIHIRKQHNVGDRYYVVAYDDEFAKFDRSKGIPNESIKHRQWKGTPIDILMDTLGVVRKSHDDCRKHFWEDYDKLRSFVTDPPDLRPPIEEQSIISVAKVLDLKRESYSSNVVGKCSCCSSQVIYGRHTMCYNCGSLLDWDEELIGSELSETVKVTEQISESETKSESTEENFEDESVGYTLAEELELFNQNLETCKDFLRQFIFKEIVDEEQLAKLDGKVVFLKFNNEPKGFFTVNHKYKRLYKYNDFYNYDYFFKWNSKVANKLYEIVYE